MASATIVKRMSGYVHTHDRRLEELYRRSPASVAFVDEAYRSDRPGEPSFYTVAALVLPFSDLTVVRDDFREMAGGDYWHTTQNFGKSDGERRLRNFVRYMAEGDDVKQFVIEDDHALVDGDIEKARQRCLWALAHLLHGKHGVELMVYERRQINQEAVDDATVAQIHKALTSLRVHAGTPSSEPLLWGPDILASTLRRRLALGDTQWFAPLQGKVHLHNTAGQAIALK